MVRAVLDFLMRQALVIIAARPAGLPLYAAGAEQRFVNVTEFLYIWQTALLITLTESS